MCWTASNAYSMVDDTDTIDQWQTIHRWIDRKEGKTKWNVNMHFDE